MRLLVLGGTSFVGRAAVQAALGQGHAVTLFHRGRTGAELFEQAVRLHGDRATGDYASLGHAEWDACIDVSAYVPRHARQAAQALHGRVGRYVLVSTVSVYDETGTGLREEVRDTEDVTSDTYGGLKVALENDAQQCWGDALSTVRPGIVAGAHDPTDRFTWWVRRAARGGRLELQGRPDQPVQVVDSRDLGQLLLAQCDRDAGGGPYDAVGPADPVTLAELARTCAQAAGTTLELVPGSGRGDLPLVVPPQTDPLFQRDPGPAHGAGMPATPLLQTAADVLAWDAERGHPPLGTGEA